MRLFGIICMTIFFICNGNTNGVEGADQFNWLAWVRRCKSDICQEHWR